MQGAFNPQACKCDCLNENVNAGGFCRDARGSCTVQKDFDFVAKTYFCPADAASTPSGAASPAPVAQGTTAAGPAQCGELAMSWGRRRTRPLWCAPCPTSLAMVAAELWPASLACVASLSAE